MKQKNNRICFFSLALHRFLHLNIELNDAQLLSDILKNLKIYLNEKLDVD